MNNLNILLQYQPPSSSNGSLWSSLICIILLIFFFWYFFLRPQRKKKENPKDEMQSDCTIPDGQDNLTNAPDPSQPSSFCTSCGTKLKPGAAFCTNCGSRIKLESNSIQTSQNNNQPKLVQEDYVTELLNYKKLLDEGIISQEEFDKKKQEILERK